MKRYDTEFKNQLIKEVTQTGSLTLVAKKHNISVKTLHYWVRGKKPLNKDVDPKHQLKLAQKKLQRAELENKILKELLKKTNQLWLTDAQSLESSLPEGSK